MTQDMFMGALRQILQAVGMLLTGTGVVTVGVVDKWTGIALLVAGPAFQIGAFAWGLKANTKASIIKSASAMPEVTSISTTSETLAASAKSADGATTVRITQPKDVSQ